MNGPPSAALSVAIDVAMGLLLVSLILAFLRLVRGPSLADRVIALDLIAFLAVGMIAVDSIATGESLVLRAGLVLALLSFVGTVAFAYYVERRGRP